MSCRPHLTLAAGLLASACNHGGSGAPSEGSAPVASTTASPEASSALAAPTVYKPFGDVKPPSGPVLAILAGQGVGPIRLGANVATIERLMELKCDELGDTRCRYLDRAVDFELTGGVTTSIVIHRMGLFADGGRRFGLFNGAIPPDLKVGMTPEAIRAKLGEPQTEEHGAPPSVLVAHYPGLTLEYDSPEPPKLALATIRVVKFSSSAGAASGAPATPKPAGRASHPDPSKVY